HPQYVAKRAMWRKYRDFYAGGEQLKANATEYLEQRQKEPPDVYGERLARVFYENYIGSIVDWYAATLFRREPEITMEGGTETGRSYFNLLAEDCDLKGSSISEFFRARLIEALVYGGSYILVDFPLAQGRVTSRAEEDRTGRSRGYLVSYTPDALTNWSLDSHGQFEWVILRSEYLRKDQPSDPQLRTETIWRYFDRTRFQVWRETKVTDSTQGPAAVPELIAEGTHSLAGQQRVPLFELKVSDGLWLMNKAALLQQEHFNKSNALSWALTMGLFATPVVYSERPWNQIVGESYYIQLGPNDRFGWTEPDGKVYQIATENLSRLQEEIYRVCYLMGHAAGQHSSIALQSGLSKARDFAITQEVLRAYGDAVKDCMKRVLRAIEIAREDEVRIDVAGLDEFDIRDFSGDLDDAQRLLSLGIESDTLRKQVYKRLAFKYLCDTRQEVKDRIGREIDSSIESAIAERVGKETHGEGKHD
ncbi:MAG TPA: hypothetical protein VES20_23630, partial [Bryobacteraceae bacterium]|nr:hypothetical protein [Bryobacteraceae bacterium]